VVTQFLGHLMRGEKLKLVDGGVQRRSFCYLDDGISALMRILKNEGGAADGRIFNVGNPANDCSVRELAETLVEVLSEFEGYESLRGAKPFEEVSAVEYYGSDYQDMATRVPDVSNAREHLGWEPKVDLREALRRTVSHYVAEQGASAEAVRTA
jgi:nucleoside-diphosphate-sugar epimerase